MKTSRDPFEKFIEENRTEFDSELPSSSVWDRISSDLRKKQEWNITWLWKVAAILFFGLSTFLVFDRYQDAPTEMAASMYEEFSTTEAYYNSLISMRKQELNDYLDEESPFYSDFQKDIQELDSIYDQLKIEFKEVNEDIVMEALIRNLQLRIEVMDKQLQIIQKVKKINENNNDDEVSI